MMIGSGLVLAAHGSRSDKCVNAIIRHHAARLATMTDFDEVAVAFHHGFPTFATVLDTLDATDVTVVPMMMSEGYFSTRVLPRELRRNRRFPLIRVRQTKPIGTLPGLSTLVHRRVAEVIRLFDLAPVDTAIVVVGHGTERHKRSGCSTVALAANLLDAALCGQVLHAFLDQRPYLQDVYDYLAKPNLLVLPFLIGGGGHVTRDIPARLGVTIPLDAAPPFAGRVEKHLVVCDLAIGTYARIADVITETVAPFARIRPYELAEIA